MPLNRRGFLIGLFGAAVITAAGAIPKAVEALTDKDFIKWVKAALPANNEIYGNGRDYAFARIKWIDQPPYIEVSIPEGFKPLREESDRIGAEALARIGKA